ncbi:alpha/beta hydrolase fold domain-containing protein [Streptomyces sp. NPDC090493]|uniref:alpha/beta hydrolase fold domain-containing protein n=1 Tax=Streptomyces sp. NPDC090493 TaxID=3365964 RepID=UPI0037FFE9AE
MTLDLVMPADVNGRPPAEPVPVVLWLHGGAWAFGSPRELPPPLRAADPLEHVLDAGWAVAAAEYRLSGEASFPAQLDDAKAAVRWLRHFAPRLGLDADRIAVWGESAGGHLASLLALTPGTTGSDEVQAAVVWYGPSDLTALQGQAHPEATLDHDAADSPESRLIGGPLSEHPGRAAAASPITYARQAPAQLPPMLLMHGTDDRFVPYQQSVGLAEALAQRGAPVELRLVDGADHLFRGADLPGLVDASIGFLSRALSPEGAFS